MLVGVDVSEGMLSVAADAAEPRRRVTRIQAAAECLPFADCVFDLVVSTSSFRHWTDHDAAMIEINRVLVPGGLLGLAELFDCRRGGMLVHLRRRAWLPPTLREAVNRAGMTMLSADNVDGFGPIAMIGVILARRPHPAEFPLRRRGYG